MLTAAISKAYQAENLAGSCLTSPLRAYNRWFQNTLQTRNNEWERIAWTVAYAASAVFAYLILGAFALIGITINLCLLPPDQEYSLWARLGGVPEATEKFCAELRDSLTCGSAYPATNGYISTSRNRGYTYHLNKQLSFNIHSTSDPLTNTRYMEAHSAHLEDAIKKLSQQYGWAPTMYSTRTENGRAIVIIPLPDHIPIPTFNESSGRIEPGMSD